MKKLVETSIVPSGGYQYTQEETDHTESADSFHQLVTRVAAHRRANNLPVPFNIADIVEAQVCENRKELCTEYIPKPPPNRALTIELALRFTRTLVAAGGKRVEVQAEADQRAAICAVCQDNIEPQGCTGCTGGLVRKAVEFIAGSRKTPYDKLLKSCKHCGCFNAAQIWMPLEALQTTISDDENSALPDHCWKRKL
jgi:hypothetical protein